MRVSEKVTIQEINSWKAGDIITIKAGTGVGKSYFIKNNLYAIAKRDNRKILFLIHRSNCKDQFELELLKANKDDVIDIVLYQKLEAGIKYDRPFNLDNYFWIVSDEFHYFMSDSWNKFTDLSLNQIINAKDKVRIFMSATGDYVKSYLNNSKKLSTIDYEIPINYSHINRLEFYHNSNTILNYIESAIKNNIKAIFFFKSAKKAYELHQMYKEYSLFNCSKSNETYCQYVDEDKIKDMLKNEKFNELILFTTTAMDAGVNIVDDELNHIVCDVGVDVGVLIQCIGRKRLQHKNDYVNVFIRSISNNELGGVETQLNKSIERANYFRKHTIQQYIEKYYREDDREQIVYDDITPFGTTKKLNELRYFKVLRDITTVQMMKTYNSKFNYCQYISELFNKPYKVAEEKELKNELEIYLNSIVGLNLYKNDTEELIEKIGLRDKRNRLQRGIGQLKSYLEENQYSYSLTSEIDTRRKLENGEKNPNFKKSYWIVGKITYSNQSCSENLE